MFTPTQFNTAMQHLREKVLLPWEFALRARRLAREHQTTLLALEREYSLDNYAFTLGKTELENCLVKLVEELNPENQPELLRILELRMSPRLCRLIWALIQNHYEMPGLRAAAAMAATASCNTEALLEVLFAREQDIFAAAVEVINQEGGDLAKFIEQYHVIEDGPLADTVFWRFFQQASERDFLVNEGFFLEMAENGSEENLKPCLVNYLELPWTFFSSRKINRVLLHRFGLPADHRSEIWEGMDSDLLIKFRQWIFIDVMEEHFGLKSKKNAIFSKFYRDIRHIRFFEESNIMVLDFELFGIVNLRNMPEISYLMEEATLITELELLAESGDPRWLVKRLNIEARDVIIEEKSADILVLNLAEVGKLYVQELMDELLRKGEELWPVRFKHAIARFREAVV